MRIAASAISACLLFSFAPEASAQTGAALRSSNDASPARHFVIQRIELDNLGEDDVIVVLSGDSAPVPFHHARRLPRGGKAVVSTPNVPSLFATVLRREEVKRAAKADPRKRKNENDKKKDGLRLSLGIAVSKDRGGGRKDGKNDKDGKNEKDGKHDKDGNSSKEDQDYGGDENHSPQQEDDYGRPPASDRESQDINNPTYHVLLSNMLGKDSVAEDRNSQSDLDGPPPGKREPIDAATREWLINGVKIAVTAGEAEVPGDQPPPAAGGGNKVAINPEPANSATSQSTPPPCYCGPDMTAAYIEALKRAHDRIKQLPNSETGPWDGAWFLSRNAGSMDEIVRPARLPGYDAAADPNAGAGAGMLCPTGPCADLPGAGSGTMSLFGVCLPKHVGNDIMYGFVGYLLNVPDTIQNFGGHWAQLNSAYSSMDPPVSRAAYAIGRNIAHLESPSIWGGVFSAENVGRLFTHAQFTTGNEITTPVRKLPALDFIRQTYPALAECLRCPADATQPGTILKDWTKSVWTLDDGSKVYPPGYSEEPLEEEQ